MSKKIIKRNISIGSVGKHRPNAKNYKISLPIEFISKWEITEENRDVNLYMEDDKIIIEKIKRK